MSVNRMICGHGYYDEPSPAEYASIEVYATVREQADAAWEAEVSAHHAYCCEAMGDADPGPCRENAPDCPCGLYQRYP